MLQDDWLLRDGGVTIEEALVSSRVFPVALSAKHTLQTSFEVFDKIWKNMFLFASCRRKQLELVSQIILIVYYNFIKV